MTYHLNKAIHPGVSVSAALEHLGMSQKNLADRTDLAEKTISLIINGEASITVETAIKFENVLGGSAAFWMNLESDYRTVLLRTEQVDKAHKEVKMISTFPYNELVKRGYVPATRDTIEKVLNLWKFFGVNSLGIVPSIEVAAYRRGFVVDDDTKKGALAAWLRCGEIEFGKAGAAKLREYNSSELKVLIPKIRSMTQMKDPNFFRELQEMLANVGVGLVAVQYFPGTKASGATRWIGQNPIIQLSTYGKDADKVWFTLFHEIGHVILHGRKDQFISFTDKSKVPEEIRADKYAANLLIPEVEYKRFVSNSLCLFEENIKKFAESLNIDPGIVLGRMKNDKILPYAAYSKMHTKLSLHDK